MEIRIREYVDKDKEALLECMIQLQNFVGLMDPLQRVRTEKDFDAVAYMQKSMNEVKKDGMIYVAEQSGKFAGCIIGIIDPPEHNLEGYPSTDGIIEELFIHPDNRGQGVGAILMKKIEEYFWSRGCSVVKVNCFAPNKKAHTFYEKLGYEDRLITLIKSNKMA